MQYNSIISGIKGEDVKSSGLTDYSQYCLSKAEYIYYAIIAAAFLFIIGYIFYRNVILSLLLCLLSFFYPKLKCKQIIIKRKHDLNIQFKDALYYLSTSISAGKSVENSFSEALKALNGIYFDPRTDIIREMELIVRRIKMNETVEAVMDDFAERSDLDDIKSFSDVFGICKRTGGNLIEVIKNTSNMIREKIEIRQEINTLISSKKLEQKILSIAPVAMILFLSSTGGDFINSLYTTFLGRIVMTIALGMIAAGYMISERIMDIRV